jgi:hypothetical protein
VRELGRDHSRGLDKHRSSRNTNFDNFNALKAGKDVLTLGKVTTAVAAKEEGLSVSQLGGRSFRSSKV